jgi:hypothetical protein
MREQEKEGDSPPERPISREGSGVRLCLYLSLPARLRYLYFQIGARSNP